MTSERSSVGRVSLLDEDLDEIFTLEAECSGAPCRVEQGKKSGVIRLVAPRPGELRLRVDNRTGIFILYFEVKKLDGDEAANAGSEVLVNDWEVLWPGQGGWLERDASTGRAMLVEAARDAQGRVVAEADPRAAETPRTRFTVAVMPAIESEDPRIRYTHWNQEPYWSVGEWLAMAGAYPRDPCDGKMWLSVFSASMSNAEDLRKVPVRPSMTVAELKVALRERLPAPAGSAAPQEHQLYLRYNRGPQLANSRTLADCGYPGHVDLFPTPGPEASELAVPVLLVKERRLEVTVRLPSAACSVADLKKHLQQAYGADPSKLKVRLPGFGWHPADECCLFYAAHPAGEAVKVLEHSDMVITVQMLTGKKVPCKFAPGWRVEDLKQELADLEGWCVEQQKFVCFSMLLENERLLLDYGIGEDTIVHCVLRLSGGGGEPVAAGPAVDGGGEEAAGPLVARVVPGQVRDDPDDVEYADVHVLRTKAAPVLTLEVSVDTAARQLPVSPLLDATACSEAAKESLPE